MNLPVEALTVWSFPEEPPPLGVEIDVLARDELMLRAQARLADVVASNVPEDELENVTSKLLPGRPAQVLLDETTDADVLVVGSRGRGALEELVFGSVADRCVRQARCPVVVVP